MFINYITVAWRNLTKNKSFSITNLLGLTIGITWWLMNNWLQHYDHRISVSLWISDNVGIVVLLLTMIIVSANTIKAALANPVKSLRTA